LYKFLEILGFSPYEALTMVMNNDQFELKLVTLVLGGDTKKGRHLSTSPKWQLQPILIKTECRRPCRQSHFHAVALPIALACFRYQTYLITSPFFHQ
jgi:hypothetical protein